MKKINYKLKITSHLSVILLSLFLLTACNEETKLGMEPTDGVAPGIPTNITVENINGGAIIHFIAPLDDDLLYVMATYTINGVERTTMVSPFTDFLKVEGFMEGEYQIKLNSVDKSKNVSEPVMVTINPTIPPVKAIFESIKIEESFGGVVLHWKNETEANVIIEAFEEKEGEWISVENFYTSAKDGKGVLRGYSANPVNFKFRVRDRWDNYSEFTEVPEGGYLPWKEVEISKKYFKKLGYYLPGDATELNSSYTIDRIWNGNTTESKCFHSGGDKGIGLCVTFDLGQEVKLSRFKMWQRTANASFIYNHNNLKRYSIYGCNEITEWMRYDSGQEDENGEVWPTFEGWNLIMEDVHCYRPSGFDSTVVTNEDKEYILGGDEHDVPIEAPSFRYIRILMLENWSGGTIGQIEEMSFWGQIINGEQPNE